MKKLLIIADDLTGALDTGVHFANRGIKTQVIPVMSDHGLQRFYDENYSVLVINTESRHVPADMAFTRVKKIIDHALKSGFDYYYKKTDSTLRGNIGTELEAMINGLSLFQLPFVPAYPKLKRYTVRGYHYINKIPLHQTEFSEDPLEPVTTSNISDILRRQTTLNIRIISKEDMKNNDLKLTGDREILIFDCKSDSHLENIAAKLNQHKLIHAVSGSAALSDYLIEYLDLSTGQNRNFNLNNPVLIVNGSLNEVSIQQVKLLAETRIFTHTFQPEELISGTDNMFDTAYRRIIREANKGNNVLIRSVENKKLLDMYLRNSIPQNLIKEAYHKASSRLGKWISELLNAGRFRTIIIFGGDTLMAVIRSLNVDGIFPQKELLPGVVASRLPDSFDHLQLITKPGGYGEKDIFNDILKFINT